jgi:hypothetical protein
LASHLDAAEGAGRETAAVEAMSNEAVEAALAVELEELTR